MDKVNAMECKTDIAKKQLREALRNLRDAWRKDGQIGQDAINIVEEVNREVLNEVLSEEWPNV